MKLIYAKFVFKVLVSEYTYSVYTVEVIVLIVWLIVLIITILCQTHNDRGSLFDKCQCGSDNKIREKTLWNYSSYT